MKGTYMFIFLFFKKILAYLVRLPLFLFHFIIDLFKYIKNKEYKEFNKFGLHIWVAKFGGGKTSSMVRTAYNLCKRYPQVTLLTNIKLSNFPEHTKILELHTVDDILQSPPDTIVLIDEIGTLFNSRDFRNGDALPKVLFQHLCQCRHRRMVIFGTVQRWQFLDKQLRDITTTVHSCHTFFGHPFSRITSETVYDAFEYERVYNNPTLTLHPLSCSVHIQSDKLRSLYDTMELVDTMLKMQYDDDNTILSNQGYSVGVGVPLERSDRHRVQRNNKRVG